MSENNKMPELAPTDIVQLRDGRYGIVLMNKQAIKHLAVFTYDDTYDDNDLACDYHLDSYIDNICTDNHNSDIIQVWKSNTLTQFGLMKTFFKEHKTPLYAEPDWIEPPKKMTLKEIEEALGYSIEIIAEK